MLSHHEALTRIKAARLVAILRHVPMEKLDGVVEALMAGGVRVLEFTFDHDRADCVKENAEKIRHTVEKYGDRIAVGIDAKDGMVSAQGWLSDTNVNYLAFAQKMAAAGVSWIIFTDISKDGMMSGPALTPLARLRKHVSCGLVASGGIRSLEDLKALDSLSVEAAILGKALYTGAIDLAKAIRWAGPQQNKKNS